VFRFTPGRNFRGIEVREARRKGAGREGKKPFGEGTLYETTTYNYQGSLSERGREVMGQGGETGGEGGGGN